MKALVLTGPREFSYQDVETPVPGPGEVRVQIRVCAVCGSDVHGMDGSTGRRRPPLIMGHEAAGDSGAAHELRMDAARADSDADVDADVYAAADAGAAADTNADADADADANAGAGSEQRLEISADQVAEYLMRRSP